MDPEQENRWPGKPRGGGGGLAASGTQAFRGQGDLVWGGASFCSSFSSSPSSGEFHARVRCANPLPDGPPQSVAHWVLSPLSQYL